MQSSVSQIYTYLRWSAEEVKRSPKKISKQVKQQLTFPLDNILNELHVREWSLTDLLTDVEDIRRFYPAKLKPKTISLNQAHTGYTDPLTII